MKNILQLIIKIFLESLTIFLRNNPNISVFIGKIIGFVGSAKLSHHLMLHKNKLELLKYGQKNLIELMSYPFTSLTIIIINLFTSTLILISVYSLEIITLEKINEDLLVLNQYLNQDRTYDEKDINALFNLINENPYLKEKYLNLNVILSAEEFNHTIINTLPDIHNINQKIIKVDLETVINILEKKKEALQNSSNKAEIITIALSIMLLSLWIYSFYN